MKKDLLITKIESLLNATPFGSVQLPKGKQFKIREYEDSDDTMVAITSVETNDMGKTQVSTANDYVIDLQDLTYRELEMVHKAIK